MKKKKHSFHPVPTRGTRWIPNSIDILGLVIHPTAVGHWLQDYNRVLLDCVKQRSSLFVIEVIFVVSVRIGSSRSVCVLSCVIMVGVQSDESRGACNVSFLHFFVFPIPNYQFIHLDYKIGALIGSTCYFELFEDSNEAGVGRFERFRFLQMKGLVFSIDFHRWDNIRTLFPFKF